MVQSAIQFHQRAIIDLIDVIYPTILPYVILLKSLSVACITLIQVDKNMAANCDTGTDAQPSPILVSTKNPKVPIES